MEGGFFLIQHVNLRRGGHDVKAIEIIGHLQPFGEAPRKDIRSRTELEGDALTIWGGEKGSPAYFKGKFSDDGNTNTGEWCTRVAATNQTMTRVKLAVKRNG